MKLFGRHLDEVDGGAPQQFQAGFGDDDFHAVGFKAVILFLTAAGIIKPQPVVDRVVGIARGGNAQRRVIQF